MAQVEGEQSELSHDVSIQGITPAVDDYASWATYAERLCQQGVQDEIASDLAHGLIITYGGIGKEAGKIFQHWPDGRRFEVRVLHSGAVEVIRQVTPLSSMTTQQSRDTKLFSLLNMAK